MQCTRKTEVRSWRTLFAYLPPPQELFEESLQRGSLKTAGGYLLILHTFEELAAASEQSVRLLSRAMHEEDWELCKELARFLTALDETGETLREVMVSVRVEEGSVSGEFTPRLAMPHIGTLSDSALISHMTRSDSDLDTRSPSDTGSGSEAKGG